MNTQDHPHTPQSFNGKEVAIIGVGLRFPQARSLEEFWQHLAAERSLVREMPSERFTYEQYSAQLDASTPGTIWGSFIEDVDCFDAPFFHISPREAELMDPQQRIALELAWKAIEHAGYRPGALATSRPGVFMGIGTSDYAELLSKHRQQIDQYTPTSTSSSIVANRISHFFDLRGTSVTVNTACASSLSAIQLAVDFLNHGEGDIALAGAVNLCLIPSRFTAFGQGGSLSRDGKSRAFDREANGYVRGEGGAIVVLKSLQKAVADNDTIYAVIKGVGVNHGGRTNSLTAPNAKAQAELIEEVYEKAGVTPDTVTYMEAHALGAPLGDSMEVFAFKTAFRRLAEKYHISSEDIACGLGSVKVNIGHLEAAAGMAGILKVIVSMQHRMLPANIHFKTLNPAIRLQESPFYIVDKAQAWTLPQKQVKAGLPRRAGVSAVSFGGVNAHVILEEYIPVVEHVGSLLQEQSIDGRQFLIPLSASNQDGLLTYAREMLAFLEAASSTQEYGPVCDLPSLAYTLQTGREAMDARVIFAVQNMTQLLEKLKAFVGGEKKLAGCWQGSRQPNAAATSLLTDDEDAHALLQQWFAKGKVEKVGEVWVQGINVDWDALYTMTHPARIGLPGYPFARKRYWLAPEEQHKKGDLSIADSTTHQSEQASSRSPLEEKHSGPQATSLVDAALINQSAEGYIQSLIVTFIAEALKMPQEEVVPEDIFAEYGLTSLVGVQLVTMLNERLGIKLASGILFDYSSVRALTHHILSRYQDEVIVHIEPSATNVSSHMPGVHAKTEPFLTTPRQPVLAPNDQTHFKGNHVHGAEKEPIAIIGMSGRFAESDTVDKLWEHLINGTDLIKEVTRWRPEEMYPEASTAQGPHCIQGSFLDRIDQFDPLFFKISGIEATYMDPQQRIFLEESWKALEDAGYVGESIAGQRCGVYAGIQKGDYDKLFTPQQQPSTAWWGNADSVIPARISYYLDLKGPAIAIDTACSSALVAIHLACQGLWNKETDMALAGGVFIQSTPWFYQMTDRANMLSPGGRCFTFDQRADGFVPGEGIGIVVLKRLSEAQAAGDHIYGVINGTGINQDGTTNGISAPSTNSQMRLEQEVYDTFGIDVAQIQMVEAHGTGTALGDPIEVDALTHAFAKYTTEKAYCALGSVKTNIGHTATSAGIASVIKVLLALKHETIPPSLHYQHMNPKLALQDGPFFVNTTPRDWKSAAYTKRQAAVSSFSFCGTNAHLVIGEAPLPERQPLPRPGYLFILSARSAEQLRLQVEQFVTHMESAPYLHLGDVSYTLFAGRRHCEHRLACVVHNREELLQLLHLWLETQQAPQVEVSTLIGSKRAEKVDLKLAGNQALQRCRALSPTDQEAYLQDLLLIGQLFIQGYALDYTALFPDRTYSRVPLPTYPFARESYWVTPSPDPSEPTTIKEKSVSRQAESIMYKHPLRLRSASTTSSELCYLSTLTGQEFFLRDHLVNSRKILPGVVYLEMVLAALADGHAISNNLPLCIENAVWSQPLVVDQEPVQAEVTLITHSEGHVAYEIHSLAQHTGQKTALHSQGYALSGPLPVAAPLDLTVLQATCRKRLSVQDCYTALRASGIAHGATLQGLTEVYVGHEQVLACLTVPISNDDSPATTDRFLLHPTMLDAAIQAAIALQLTDDEHVVTSGRTALPFALQRLECYAACPPRMWAWIRYSPGSHAGDRVEKLDLDLCDEAGAVCVRLQGYSSRVVAREKPATEVIAASSQEASGSDTSMKLLLRPVWEATTIDSATKTHLPAHDERVLMCGGTVEQKQMLQALFPTAHLLTAANDATQEALMEQMQAFGRISHLIWIAPEQHILKISNIDELSTTQDQGVLSLFRLVKALLHLGYGSQILHWTVITTQSQSINEQHSCLPAHASVHGFVGSLAKEYPDWHLYLVDLPLKKAWPFSEIFSLPDDPQGLTWCYRQGQWYRQHLVPCQLPATMQQTAYRPGGVYLVIGGAGGLGEVWSEYMIHTYQAQVVWLGRRPLDATIRAKQERLAQIGPAPLYLDLDAAHLQSLQQARATILARYKRLDGIVHSAVVLRDKSLANMDEERFRTTLSTKVDISVRMAQVFGHDALDFILFFSSVQSYTRAPGQSNYAAGTTFEDAFAHWLSQHSCSAIKVMNWGYWGSVGVVSSDVYKRYMARAGLGSVEAPEAMQALETLMRNPALQLTFVNMTRQDALPGVKLEVNISPVEMVPTNQQKKVQAETMSSVRPEGLRSATVAYLKTAISEALQLDIKQIRADEHLENYGIDSLVIVTVTNRLERVFGSLSKTLFFEYITIQELATYFIENHQDRLEAILFPQSDELVASGDRVEAPYEASREKVSPPTHENPVVRDSPLVNTLYQNVNDKQEFSGDHDIAVVGIAGRFPHADNLEELWHILQHGQDCFESIPTSRWQQKEIYYPERDILGKTVMKTGTFINDIDKFDPRYFNISQRDADLMSPEVRLFLQVSVEALEDAGYSKEYLQRKYNGDVGVLVNSMFNDYRLYGFENMLTRGSLASGSDQGLFPNQLSYYYGFTGPSIFLDTMCSSASVCIDLAVRMLRARQCKMILVGGINLYSHPYTMISGSQAHFTTKTSEIIRSYGMGADGTVVGESVIAAILKPLADAQRDGDHIYTVIKGTGTANAGPRNGITVPDPKAQAATIERAIEDAGIDPRTISYLEGHGSGTSLGDPIEIRAASNAFQKYTQDLQFCPIGSVKSNIAHTMSASGLAGLTKVVLQLKHQKLVPSLHAEQLNPHIDFAATPFYVQRELTDWQRPTVLEHGQQRVYPRRAGITSIGAVGMSAHIIVEEYPEQRSSRDQRIDGPYLMAFSAMNVGALKVSLGRIKDYVAQNPALDLAALSYTLQVGKNGLPCRIAMIVHDRADLLKRISRLLTTEQDWETIKHQLNVYYTKSTREQEVFFTDQELQRIARSQDRVRAAESWVQGADLNWDAMWGETRPGRISLPAYPFEKIRCWYTPHPDVPSVVNPLGEANKLHPFIGKNESDLFATKYTTAIYQDELLDYVYRVGRERHIIPTFVLDTVFALATIAGLSDSVVLRNVTWHGAFNWQAVAQLSSTLSMNEQAYVRCQLMLKDQQGKASILGSTNIQRSGASYDRDNPDVHETPARMKANARASINKERLYLALAEGRLHYDPFLEGIESIYSLEKQRYLAQITAPALQQDHHKKNIHLQPVALGAILQGCQYIARECGLVGWAHFVPLTIGEAYLSTNSLDVAYLLFYLSVYEGMLQGEVQLLDSDGRVVGRLMDTWFGDPEQTSSKRLIETRLKEETASAVHKTHVPFNEREAVWQAVPAIPDATLTASSSRISQPQGLQESGRQFLEQTLRAIVSEIVKFSFDEIDIATRFHAYGFDSITLARLVKEINQEFNITLSPAILFQYENIKDLRDHIAAQYGTQVEALWRGKIRPSISQAAQPSQREVFRYEEEAQKQIQLPVEPSVYEQPQPPIAQALVALPEQANRHHEHEQEVDARRAMPIAIIGVAGRFPQSRDLQEFADHVFAGDDLVGPFPLDRYDGVYQEIVQSLTFPKRMGALTDVDTFDADFFDISPLEAELMDPQHRLALETVWHAIEDSGYRASQLPENTGVFMGVSGTDYASLLATYKVPPDAWTSTGNSHAMLANRISYMLDIHGPSEPIDTACSSSLVAVHRAMESIRSGRCDLAIAGGVNLLLSVDTFVSAYQAGMLSPDGTCKTFAPDADGYVRGEGVGALVLKPLTQARQDGDHILGVLIGSAENHGGRASSLTAPNTKAQAQLITDAMQGIDPRTVSYVEVHGTGTKLGDPVEIEGLKLAYSQLLAENNTPTSQKAFCGVGSLKTNIGHLEAAAGVAGVIKVLLMMQQNELPATLHCQQLNPYLDIADSPFYILQEKQNWPQQQDDHGCVTPRRAGVSSFGFGGANAHVVIEEYVDKQDRHERQSGPYVILLSAKNENQLKESARQLLSHLKNRPQLEECMAQIAYTLQIGREEMAIRLALVVSSAQELEAKLTNFLHGQERISGLYYGEVEQTRSGLAVFTADGKLEAFADNWIKRKQYGSILAQWVRGLQFDWRRLYVDKTPGRVSLPGYPFARDRYWLPQSASDPAQVSPIKQAQSFDEASISQILDDVLKNSLTLEDAAKNIASFL